MTTCPSNCGNCCPEAPDITLTENTVMVGDLVAKFYHDNNLALVAGTTDVVQLTNTPIANQSISWFVNGIHQDDDHVTGSGRTWTFDEDMTGKNITALYVMVEDDADTEGDFTTGSVKFWPATATVESGWLLCDASTPLIADYPALWAIYGTDFGGDGVTTFGLPPAGSPIAGMVAVCKT